MLNNIKLLKRLENIAWENLSRESRCFHVAFIFRGNNILSVGTNSNKTHPKIKQYIYIRTNECIFNIMWYLDRRRMGVSF